jgi:hypothetical protein
MAKRKGEKTNVASRGVVRVQAEKCATCIFRPGNQMELRKGRVRDMVDAIRDIEGVIPCHETLENEEQAVCKGQYDMYQTPLLRLAEVMDKIEWVKEEEQ